MLIIAPHQPLRVNDVLVKFEVVEFMKAKDATPVVIMVPVAVTDELDVVSAVAVVLYAVVDEAMYPFAVTVVVVEAVTAVAPVLAADHAIRMYQSVSAVATLAVDAVASQIWKLFVAAVADIPARVVGVHVTVKLHVAFVDVPVAKDAATVVAAEAIVIYEYAKAKRQRTMMIFI